MPMPCPCAGIPQDVSVAVVYQMPIWYVRELPVKAEQDSLQAPYITYIPDPIHERQLGAQDHIVELALRDSHCALFVKSDVGSDYVCGESVLSTGPYPPLHSLIW